MKEKQRRFGLPRSFQLKLGSMKLDCIFALVLTVGVVVGSFALADSQKKKDSKQKPVVLKPSKKFTSRAVLPPIGKVSQPTDLKKIKNVILLIGDGMGPDQIKAASCFAYGKPGRLTFQQLPYSGKVSTYALARRRLFPGKLFKTVTDSAAAATAIATGRKVFNGVISLELPGSGKPLKTILEQAKDASWKTGLVTTCEITHATPAGFVAHVKSRNFARRIGVQMLKSKTDILFGGGCKFMKPQTAKKQGYRVVENREQMNQIQSLEKPVLGRFGLGHLIYEYHLVKRKSNSDADSKNDAAKIANQNYKTLPHLSEMTTKALELLSKDNQSGFFLMIEGGRIDHAGHINSLKRNIYETLEFDLAVRRVIQWASKRDDTLVIVTADHETGGLKVEKNNGVGNWPTVTWQSRGHSNADVFIYALGIGAEEFTDKMNNTDIPTKIREIIKKHGSQKAGKAFYDPEYKEPKTDN